jgi:hypothetical protein
MVMTNWHAGRGGDVFTIVPRERQKRSVAFLNERGFQPPRALLRADVLNRLQPWGWTDRVLGSQTGLLNRVLADARINRLIELEARFGTRAYPAREMLGDLRQGLFQELGHAEPRIDVYRRNIQAVYVRNLLDKLQNSGPQVRALARGELQTLQTELSKGHAASKDDLTRLHLEELLVAVRDALAPKR